MKRLLNNAVRCVSAFAVLSLWGCSSDDPASPVPAAPTAGTPGVAGATGTAGATSGTVAPGAAGSRSTPGAPGAAGTLGGAGMTAGAAGATSSTAGAAGMPSATAGMAGMAAGGAAAPAGAGGAAAPASTRPLASTRKLPTTMENPGVAPYFNVWRPTDLNAVEGKLPVFVWNNGACSRNDGVFKALFEKWASGGWVVLSLTSGGGGSSSTSIADQKGLIDWVVEQADMAGGEYNGKLDLERITAGGNSCGGITALGLAAEDDRVAGIFVLSGSSGMGGANTTVTSAIKIPVSYVVGGDEDIARANAEADYEAFADGIASMIVSRSSGDHLMISNNADVMVDAADMSLNWLDLTMYGLKGALDALNSPTVCEGCESGLWTLKAKNLESLVK
jgi:hypothetical protein